MHKLFKQYRVALSLIGAMTVFVGGIALVAAVFKPGTAQAATVLVGTTDSMEVVTTTTAALHLTASYVDYSAAAATPGSTSAIINTATTTTFIAAPGSGVQRQLKRVNFRNTSTTTTNDITIQKDVSGTNYETFSMNLGPQESLTIDSEGERHVYGSDGLEKIPGTASIDGRTLSWLKVGATSEATGLWQGIAKDSGFPGAWVPGTPGLNGDAVSCSTTADATIAGAPYLPDPASGSYYLTAASAGTSVAAMTALVDLVWFNTGLVVTTTTAQAVTMPTLPNRDTNGSADGDGWQAGIYVTTATTNASPVANTTLSYTDSDGNAGNTATITSFPSTAIAGTFIPFLLAAGDRGIRNIASVTLGSSYGGGAISLVLYRPVVYIPSVVANIGGALMTVNAAPTGVKLWNGTCLWPMYLASATTANTVNLAANLTVR